MKRPNLKTLLALLVSSIVGLLAGMLALHVLGEPTPFGGGQR